MAKSQSNIKPEKQVPKGIDEKICCNFTRRFESYRRRSKRHYLFRQKRHKNTVKFVHRSGDHRPEFSL